MVPSVRNVVGIDVCVFERAEARSGEVISTGRSRCSRETGSRLWNRLPQRGVSKVQQNYFIAAAPVLIDVCWDRALPSACRRSALENKANRKPLW